MFDNPPTHIRIRITAEHLDVVSSEFHFAEVAVGEMEIVVITRKFTTIRTESVQTTDEETWFMAVTLVCRARIRIPHHMPIDVGGAISIRARKLKILYSAPEFVFGTVIGCFENGANSSTVQINRT